MPPEPCTELFPISFEITWIAAPVKVNLLQVEGGAAPINIFFLDEKDAEENDEMEKENSMRKGRK